MMHNKNPGRGIVVIGGQWGDEGKGRIVDAIAKDCDVVVRFQGGNNAGHSLQIGDISLVLHLIPCGIMRKDKICMIANGVVIDPEILFQEIELLKKHGIVCDPSNLKIAKNAHIIFPFHKMIDHKREMQKSSQIGTTKRGIGPCYEDKVARFGITAIDLLSEGVLEKKLRNVLSHRSLDDDLKNQTISFHEVFSEARAFGEKLAPFLCDVGEVLNEYLKNGRSVLFEGAQGTLLDVDHGTYPYVTSSNCVAAQASIGSGIGMNWFKEVLMVSKAYCTRVGEGPFFTEVGEKQQEQFRTLGNEFGATTNRPRRCGWLDLVALKYSARLNGASGLVLTKLDILAGLGPVKIATSYNSIHKKNLSFLDAMVLHAQGEQIEINYLDLPPLGPLPTKVNKISDLPRPYRELCSMIETTVDIPIKMVSYGPKRGQEFLVNS